MKTFVQKRAVRASRRVVRAGEVDAPELRECEFADCRGQFLPYKRDQKFCRPQCRAAAESRRRREWHRVYNAAWREAHPREMLKYRKHQRNYYRQKRAAEGAASRPERWID